MLYFIHGMNNGPEGWKPYVKFFENKGYNCKTIDLMDGLNLKKTRFNDYIDKVLALVSEEDILIGQSMGGLIIQKVAEKIKIKAAVGICPAPPNGIIFKPIGITKQLSYLPYILFNIPFKPSYKICKELMFNGMDEKLAKKHYATLRKQSAKVSYEITKNKIIIDEQKIKTPLFFIAKENDKTIPPDIVEMIADKYNAEFKIHKGIHYILSNWEPIAKDIYDFIIKI